MNAGVRITSMPGASPRMFEDGSLEADVNMTQPLGEWLAEQITAADEARITSPLGTDLRLSIKGRRGGGSYGVADVPGAFTVTPCLESTVGPVEWTAEGRVIVDGVVVPGGMVTQPFEVVLEKDTVSPIGEGHDAEALK
jgi:leucyl aminopeptidase (aminopeptidase T)